MKSCKGLLGALDLLVLLGVPGKGEDGRVEKGVWVREPVGGDREQERNCRRYMENDRV